MDESIGLLMLEALDRGEIALLSPLFGITEDAVIGYDPILPSCGLQLLLDQQRHDHG